MARDDIDRAGEGGLQGALLGFMLKQNPKAALLGGAGGAAANVAGYNMADDDPVLGGALGGGMLGAGAGAAQATMGTGDELIASLIKKGMSRNKAMSLIAVAGAGLGGLAGAAFGAGTGTLEENYS